MYLKKILLGVAAVFLVYQSYKLFFVAVASGDSWLNAVIIGFFLNLFITGVSAFLGFALPTQKLLPDAYYNIRHPENLRFTYECLNVSLFRKFLLATFWKKKSQRKKFFNGRSDGIANFILQTKKSEFGHLLPFTGLILLSGYFLLEGQLKVSLNSDNKCTTHG